MKQAHHTGMWIAVFGPDGVGKSTVIAQVERQLAPSFAGMSRFHFRPRFRRSCPLAAPVTQPHAKPARGTAVTFAKLLFWLADCWWGYLSMVVPRKSAGQLIIYDRYLPDILIDPVRYRLPAASNRFAAWVVSLLPRPDLYVLLDASAEVVQQRKCELPLVESRRQRVAYLKMFQSLPCKLLVNADSSTEEVGRRVAAGICSLHTYFVQPYQ